MLPQAARWRRQGVWLGIAVIVVGLLIAAMISGPHVYDQYAAATLMAFFLLSGMLFIVFAWRAEDGRLLALRYRLVLAATPLIVLAVLMILFVITLYMVIEDMPPTPSVADMLADHALLDCDILEPAAEEARFEMAMAQFGGGLTKDEIRYYGQVHALYWQNCA